MTDIVWTDERKKLVIDLRAQGKSARAIAEAIGNGCTKNAILGLVHRLGLPARNPSIRIPGALVADATRLKGFWTKEKTQALRDLWAAGKSQKEIVAVLGAASVAAVSNKRIELGLPVRDSLKAMQAGSAARSRPEKSQRVASEVERRAPKVIDRDAFTAPPGDFTIDLQDLRPRGDCRWPYGERAPYQFCGRPATDGVYCEGHGKVAFRSVERPSAMERRIAGAGLRMKCEVVHA